MFRGGLEPWHIIVILVVLLLLFGGKRMPDAARSLGRSMRILKAETKGLAHDDEETDDSAAKTDPAARSADIPQPLPPGRTVAAQDAPTPTPVTTPTSQTTSADAARDQR